MDQTVRAHDGLPRSVERLILGVVVVALMAGLGVLVVGGMAARQGVTNADATHACRDVVESRLRAPSTASWAWLDDEKVARAADGTFTVRSYVDAQNGFGAQIRTRYTCVVRPPAPDGKTWHLVSLEM